MRKLLLLCTWLLAITLITSCDMPWLKQNEPEHQHEFGEWKTVKEPSCTSVGKREQICFCKEKNTEDIAALGHKNVLYAMVEPTCEEEGFNEYKCSVCNSVTKDDFTPKLGHYYSEGYIYSDDATASRDGTVLGYCRVCDRMEFEDVPGSAEVIANAFKGKKVSVIGDSISTFYDVSSGIAAETTNSTVKNNSMFYGKAKAEYLGMTLNDTWWMQTINALGAELLVNHSNSGGYTKDYKKNGQPPAYLTPAENLHDNTGEDAGTMPDIVLVYLGTNDYGRYYNNPGNIDDIDFENLGEKCGADYVAESFLEAYAIMLYKITTQYEGVEVYCLNILESILWGAKDAYLADFNDAMFEVAERLGAYTVDIYRDSGIKNNEDYDKYIPADDGRGGTDKNTLHPNGAGMTLIANCVIKAVRENSQYYPSEEEFLGNYGND